MMEDGGSPAAGIGRDIQRVTEDSIQQAQIAKKQLKKQATFQNAVITEMASNGTYAIDFAGRDVSRSGVGVMGNVQLGPLQNAVVLNSGNKNMPMILGQSSWITG